MVSANTDETVVMRTYVYVDGENHFRRSQERAEVVFGHPRSLEALSAANFTSHGFPRRSDDAPRRSILDEESLFFWDCGCLNSVVNEVQRAVCFTSCCSESRASQIKRRLRKWEFEAEVVVELKQDFRRRRKLRDSLKMIDKPKGCDIAMTTRMVADAAADLYDACCLFTSDADFLPAIQAIRNMGKRVVVLGYAACLKDDESSPYLYTPDQFIDLEYDNLRYIGERAPAYRKMMEDEIAQLRQTDLVSIEYSARIDGRDDLALVGVLQRYSNSITANPDTQKSAEEILENFKNILSQDAERLSLR